MNHKCCLLSLITMFSLRADIDPVAYNASNAGQFKHAIKELYKLNLSGSEHILDIGSGDGRTSSYIMQEYLPSGRLVGIDNDREMVAFAHAHATSNQVSYQVADIRDYVIPNEYDAITSFWTLHWVKEYDLALNNIAQSLKPGGKALLCHIVGINPLRRIVSELLKLDKWAAYKNHASKLNHSPSLVQIAQALEQT